MKKVLFLFLSIILLIGCKDKITDHYTANIPVYMDFDEFRNPISYSVAKDIDEVSGLFLHDTYLFLIDPQEGIHIVNNADPNNPNNIGYIHIIGVTNVDVKGNYLYADSYIDLVVIDITDINNPIEVAREPNHFRSFSMTNYDDNYPAEEIDFTRGVVVRWELGETSKEVDNVYYQSDFLASIDGVITLNSTTTGVNISGSITKFAIVGDYLYAVTDNKLTPFNISNPLNISLGATQDINYEVETVFDYNNHLFCGTTTGMLIFDTNDPGNPENISVIDHVYACDPVVVQGDYAYVTLRTGTRCWGTINQLEVFDISDYHNPVTIDTYPMTNPNGLGVDEDLLFICDGEDGLKIFDNTNPHEVGNQLIAHFPEIEAIDVIPFDNVLMLIGTNGLRQYDYSDMNNIYEISYIPFN